MDDSSIGLPSGLSAPVVARSCYTQVLEKLKQPAAQPVTNDVREFIGHFPANLTRPQAARKIHNFLSDATPRFLETQVFVEESSEEAREIAMEGLEKLVVLKLYKLLFRHAPADLREDEHVDNCIRKSSPGPFLPTLSHEENQSCEAAVLELKKVNQYRAPRDKVVCMLNAHRIIAGIVEEITRKDDAGEDVADQNELLLQNLLAGLIIKAAPEYLFSNVEFAIAFRHPSQITVEERRSLQDFTTALALVTDVELPKQRLPEGERVDSTEPGIYASRALNNSPPWLVDAGVTFHFVECSVEELRVGETDELLDEYHRMVRALRDLSGVAQTSTDSNLPTAS